MSVILRVGAVKPNRGQESHYGSGDEASSSYTDADVLDIPLPEHTYQRPSPPTSSFTQNSTGYFGLPYQDHNYGMPPPPSPPRPASPRPPSPLQVNGVVQMEEEVNTTPLVCVEEEVVEDSVTRCICGYLHDDGYMICCDKCSVWQHIDCMGVDRNNIPESYFCEVCQPRILDAAKAKSLQKRKREELAARNVLSDSSATDTDPEEAANALASMGRKLPSSKKKGFRQKRSKVKDKPPLKLKISKTLSQKKQKKSGKKEKENIKNNKPKRLFKSGSQKLKSGKMKSRPLLTLEQLSGDPWNSSLSPWVDSYDYAEENQYSAAVREFSCDSHLIGQSVDISSIMPDQLLAQLTSVADVKKNRKGLRTTQEIPAGQAIIEYKGKVMLRHDYDKEHAFVNSFKRLQPFVLFYSKLDADLCVDARTYGNEARFVRRSCTPNSEVQHIFSQGKIYFVIVSQKDIQAGAEITIPFDYNYQDCSYCVECACIKNNCVVSRYWKKLKNAQKSSIKDFTAKQKKQSSGADGAKATLNDGSNSSSSQTSPSKASSSPVKALQIKLAAGASPPPLTSPIMSTNVSTLLAASALLDGQPDLADTFKLEVSETLQHTPPPPAPPPPPPKSATSSRRGSRVSEDSIKEEKPQVGPISNVKDKNKKQKEPKLKDKESKDHQYHNTEIKKEKRPSSRRQSQDDSQDSTDLKSEIAAAAAPAVTPGSESEESATAAENRKKMTREERKLDAIMKAFEKMEKREERRKEAMSRGVEPSAKKCAEGSKPKKKEDADGNSGTCSSVQSRSASQEGQGEVEDNIKAEHPVDDQQPQTKSPAAGGGEAKLELSVPESSTASSTTDSTNPSSTISSVSSFLDTVKPVLEESPQKPVRKSGKRKRRRSRVQSATALSDAASVSTDEGNSNSSFPPAPLSMPVTPAATPLNTPMPPSDVDGGMFKYIKIKKHLFEEWSQKQEDDNSRQEEEMFVQCLPNPHVNTMDHLQRRNSHSAGCKGPESSAGSAKKRWLRQAMHDVPAPIAFNHTLSVSTDSGSASPVYGGASPNPGTGLGSPGAASPLDFVTPLKKRRLMRESVSSESNGPLSSPGPGILAENYTSNGVTPKTNGVKQFFPAHRHSTDDRLLLHKGYPHQNGLRDTLSLTGGKRSVTGTVSSPATTQINLDHHLGMKEVEMCSTSPELPVDTVTASAIAIPPLPLPLPHVNGISEAVPISSVPFTQPRTKFRVKFRGIFERMEVDSTGESSKEKEIQATASSSRILENGVSSFRSTLPGLVDGPSSKFEDDSLIDSSASTSTVVVVNSSGVYSTSSVNTLMDEGSEAGCVTAKSIMDVDRPAIVRVDLNAHEMEPSSLSDSRAVVNLTDSFFRGSILNKRFDTPNECQVNSSGDIEAMPFVTEGHNSDICDNTCTDSSSAQVCSLRGREGENAVNEVVEEEMEAVDSSQHENGVGDEFVLAVEEQRAGNSASDRSIFRHPSTSKLDMEFISSSGQPSSNHTDSTSVESNSVCDSVEEATEEVQPDDSRHCDSGSVVLGENRAAEVSERNAGCEEIRTCDSVEGNSDFSSVLASTSMATESSSAEAVGDGAVSESHCSDGAAFFGSAVDSNVDSTSCETSKSTTHQLPSVVSVDLSSDAAVNVDSCCDSNFERQSTAVSLFENSYFGDESSLEGQGVSSSNVTDLQISNNSWDSDRDVRRDSLPDNSVSARTPEYNSGISQSSSANPRQSSISTATQEQLDLNIESQPSSSAVSRPSSFPQTNSNVQSSSQFHTSHPPSSPPLSVSTSPLPSSSTSSLSSAISADGVLSSTSPGACVVQPTTTVTLDSSAVPVTSSPPTSSTGEATPAVKKKVSLLEYRKRLKEKPASSSAETKMSVAAESSPSSSSTTHHHKLSNTLSLFLSSSSPTASSSTSTSPAKSPSSSSISPRNKHKMPTLATLPLFKSSGPNKDEKKRHKPKPEKQLSLTERLRLEFGLDDCEDDANKKKKDACLKHRGRASPPPPPPPLHPPPLLPHGASLHHHHHPVTRHNVTDAEESEVASSNGGVDDSVPPPPPPTTASGSGYLSPAVASGFVASSTHPRAGFHGSPAPLVNGGPGSSYNYHQQQPSISSTSLSTPPPLSSHPTGGRERHSSGFSGHNGTQGSLPSHPAVAPYQQQPSSSSLSTSPHHIPPHAQAPHQHSWAANQGPHPSAVASVPQPSTNPQHPPPLQYDYNHRQPSQTQTAVSGNVLSEDHPPPPPPPPPRSHHRPSSSHRHIHHHHHQSSSRKSKSSKAAASSSTSSRYSDNRSRY